MSDDDATGAESPPRGVDSYFKPGNFEDPSPIIYPAAANGAVSNFKIQPNLIAILPMFRDQAKAWFTSLEPGSIHSWSEMQSAFLDEFYSISKTVAIRNKIKSFCQIPNEQFHEAFCRLKELLITCPRHDVPKWELVKVFCYGLDYHNQQFVMETSGGMFFSRPIEEEWEFFEKLSKGSKTQASVDPNNNHTSSANFVSNQHGTNFEISELSKKVDLLLRSLGKGVLNVSQVSHNACSMCGDPSHSINNFQSWGVPSNEEVNGVYGNRPRNDPFSKSYNPRWGNHPNFCWKDDDNYNRPNNTQQQNHGYKPRQLAKEVHKRKAGKLPSYPTLNLKHKPGGHEHVNMVTSLRNGKTYNNDIKIASVHDFSHNVEDFVTDDEIVVEGNKADNVKSDSELVNGLAKKGSHYEEMWNTFKQVKINLPLIDAIKRIPVYAKFLKDLCTQKRKLKATLPKKIDQTEHVIVVGNITIKMALLDLDASINILPASLVDKYDLGTLPTIDARINCRTGAMDITFGNKKLRLNVFNSLNSPISNDYYHIDTIDECIQTHTPSMNLDRTLENLHYVDSEKELFDGMTFYEKEEEFQMIEEEFLLSLEETPLQSQQVQQPTLNEVQEYFDCLLVHQDMPLRARCSNKGNDCVRKRSWKKMVRIRLRRKHRRIRVKIKKSKFLRSRNKKVDELFALDTITRMITSFLKTYAGNVHGKHSELPNDH
nr:hypothetical protein [Tanacetum cinerariifolium]